MMEWTMPRAITVLVVWPFSVAFNGYALSLIWGWFVAAKFGLPTISVAEAIGLSVVTHAFTFHDRESIEHDFNEAMVLMIGRPLLLLGIGWIVLQFV